MSGFYLLHRGWMDNKLFSSVKRDPLCKRAAWVWLIEHAAFAGERRGRLSFSVRYLGEAWGWPNTKVFRFLKACVSEKMLECSSGTGQLDISICNYGAYQFSGRSDETPNGVTVERERNTTGTNIEEGSKKEEDSEAKASGANAPDPVADLWKRGKAILGQSAASLIGKARKAHNDLVVMQAIIACEAEHPSHPVEFFIGCLRRATKENPHDAETRAFRLVTSREGDSGPDSSLALAFLDPAGTG